MANQTRTALIIAPFEDQWVEDIRQFAPDLRVERRIRQQVASIPDELWHEAEILYTFATGIPTPQQAPNLRWVQLYSAGADPVLEQPLYQADVQFTTSSGVHAVNIAEYVLTMMLEWSHHVPQLLDFQHRAEWPSFEQRNSIFLAEELWNKTIGIVGYGSIGRQVARLAKAFGMRVLAMQRGSDHRDQGFQFPGVGDPEGSLPDRYYQFEQLHDLLRESDYVLIGLPLTAQTRHLFNDTAFQAMKKTAFLINIARGEVCDEDALLRALREQSIAGAALDVFRQEPLPPESPFWSQPNVFIYPHITGLTPHYDERAATIFKENLRRYLKGETLYNLVDKQRGY